MTPKQSLDWRVLAIVYALAVAAFVARAYYFAPGAPLLADTDDAMRLTTVRDFLAGQAWYDNVQHRLNTPYGAEIHWSRLTDLPLAGLILLLRPFLGANAEMVAACVLPLLLLFVLLWLCARVTLALVGSEGILPAVALPALSLSVLSEFAPGRIDHHSFQILLLLLMAWCSIEALQRPRFAIGAGLAAATSLGVGIEGLPSVAAAILAFGLMWVTRPRRADALRGFGLSFGLGTLAHLAIALPPERWLTPACDAISLTYAAAAFGTGAIFVALSLLPLAARSMWLRLAIGLASGVALALVLAVAFPACLRGPYAALDPWLVEHWLSRITEVAPFWNAFVARPIYPLAVGLPPLVAVGATLWRVTRGPAEGRGEWLVYAAFLALCVAAMLIQIRASRLVTSLAVPGAAALIVMARHYYLERRNLQRAGVLIVSWLVSAGVAIAIVAALAVPLIPRYASIADEDPELADRRACVMPEAFADLAAMPPERVMTPVDLGSHMLAFTPHAVVAAPYHRNQAGVRDAFDFFGGPLDEARAILDRRGVTLVVVCPVMPELRRAATERPDSLAGALKAGLLPEWLTEVGLPGATLRIFAVTPR